MWCILRTVDTCKAIELVHQTKHPTNRMARAMVPLLSLFLLMCVRTLGYVYRHISSYPRVYATLRSLCSRQTHWYRKQMRSEYAWRGRFSLRESVAGKKAWSVNTLYVWYIYVYVNVYTLDYLPVNHHYHHHPYHIIIYVSSSGLKRHAALLTLVMLYMFRGLTIYAGILDIKIWNKIGRYLFQV